MSRNEDEAERAEKVEKGTKVRRTLSSLRNRMTGSFNKDKVQGGERRRGPPRAAEGHRPRTQPLNPPTLSLCPPQGKNREKGRQRGRLAAGAAAEGGSSHRLVPGSFSSCATCSICSKTLQKKHGLQCMSE